MDNRLAHLRDILRPARRDGILHAAVEWAKYERYEELATPIRGLTMLDTPDVNIGSTYKRRVRGQDSKVEILVVIGTAGWKAKNLATGEEVPHRKSVGLFGDKEVRHITRFPGGKNIEQLRTEKIAIERALKPEEFMAVQRTVEGLRKYSQSLIAEARDAGILSKEAYNAIISRNQKYIPLQRLEMLAAEIEKAPNRFANSSDAFNVASQDLVHAIHGSTKEVADPLEVLSSAIPIRQYLSLSGTR